MGKRQTPKDQTNKPIDGNELWAGPDAVLFTGPVSDLVDDCYPMDIISDDGRPFKVLKRKEGG